MREALRVGLEEPLSPEPVERTDEAIARLATLLREHGHELPAWPAARKRELEAKEPTLAKLAWTRGNVPPLQLDRAIAELSAFVAELGTTGTRRPRTLPERVG